MVVPITYENPAGFNADWYTSQYSDLAGLSPDQALAHYINYGQAEGRLPNQAIAAQPSYAKGAPVGGVRDISVEPLTQWERAGLTSLAGIGNMAPEQYAQGAGLLSSLAQQPMINPLAQGAFEQMQGAIRSGTQRMTPADIQRYMNPYQSQVIDRLTQNLTEQGQRAMAKLQAQDVGRSAGGSSRAIQQGMLQRDLGNTLADQQANLLYQGFADALGQFNAEQGRYLQGAQQYGQMGTGAQGITESGARTGLDIANALTGLGLRGIQNQIGAGKTVRDYNQMLTDRTRGALQGQMDYSGNQLANLLNQINSIQGGTNVTNYTEPSTLGRVSSGLSGLGDIYNQYNRSNYESGGFRSPYNPTNTYFPPNSPLPWR